MNILPVCNIADRPATTYELENNDDYNDLIKQIENYVGADCWAVKVDDEIIFNSYNDATKIYKELITEDCIRGKIIESPHSSILVHINRRGVNAKFEIYMFPRPESYKIMILFEANQKKYTVQQFNSPEYNNRFGLDVEF